MKNKDYDMTKSKKLFDDKVSFYVTSIFRPIRSKDAPTRRCAPPSSSDCASCLMSCVRQ